MGYPRSSVVRGPCGCGWVPGCLCVPSPWPLMSGMMACGVLGLAAWPGELGAG